MDVLNFLPKTGLFRVVEKGKHCNWYYRHFSDDWTTNENDASLMTRKQADDVVKKYHHDLSVRIEFVREG